ncbi:MAG: LuxR C-terminal-related transcriptional regulator [Sulfurifustis sp.]
MALHQKKAGAEQVALLKHPHHLINAKLKPPHAASLWVERKALLARVDEALRKKLVLLVAPIGSGKTTLLSQWYRHAAPTRSIVWLSLDEHDNEPVRFFSYLVGALRSAVEDFSAYIASRSDEQVELLLDHVSAVFLESLRAIERDLVIVLDDFQSISDPGILRAFLFLLQHSTPNVHWLIASRHLPELSLTQLKLQDELSVLGSNELNFAADDIAHLSEKLYGKALSTADADYIRARTEGWIAGAKLALLSASEPATARESLKQFTGSHSEVTRYLATAVLRDQPDEVRDFLIASSIADKVNGDLCNALLGISNGQVLLQKLEESQLFIQPLDSQQQWYRYHVLFLDFLRSCLRRDFASRMPQLHKTASQWFAEHQMTDEALAHAFASGDRAWCVELVARCVEKWLKDGEITEVLRWTGKLTREEILRHGDISNAYITSLILLRRFGEAAAALHEVERYLVYGPPSGRTGKVAVKMLNLMLAILSDTAEDVGAMDDERLLDDAVDPILTGTLMTVQAYRLLRHSKFDAARRLALRARDVLKATNSVYGIGYAEMVLCLADRGQGDMKMAAQRCEQLYATVRGGRRNPAWVNAATALSHVRYEQNRLAEAEALCTEVLPFLSDASTVENLTIAYITFARVKSVNKRHAEAFQLLDYLHSVLESGGHRRFLARVCFEKIRLCLLQGNFDRASAVAAEFELPLLMSRCEWQEPRPYDEGWEHLGFAQATLLLHEQRYTECRALLEVLRDSAHRAGYVYRELPLEAALAACYWRAGKQEAALSALNRGFALARQFGFSRGVFDEVPDLKMVIGATIKTDKLRGLLPERYFKRFQDIFAEQRDVAPPPETKRKPALPLEPLTERELDILKLLAQGLSNKEISRRSQVALSTAKWHLKNVFAKLDVTTRTGAIIRARELQLIDS